MELEHVLADGVVLSGLLAAVGEATLWIAHVVDHLQHTEAVARQRADTARRRAESAQKRAAAAAQPDSWQNWSNTAAAEASAEEPDPVPQPKLPFLHGVAVGGAFDAVGALHLAECGFDAAHTPGSARAMGASAPEGEIAAAPDTLLALADAVCSTNALLHLEMEPPPSALLSALSGRGARSAHSPGPASDVPLQCCRRIAAALRRNAELHGAHAPAARGSNGYEAPARDGGDGGDGAAEVDAIDSDSSADQVADDALIDKFESDLGSSPTWLRRLAFRTRLRQKRRTAAARIIQIFWRGILDIKSGREYEVVFETTPLGLEFEETLVNRVEPGGSAAQLGVKLGSRCVAVNRVRVANGMEMALLVQQHTVGMGDIEAQGSGHLEHDRGGHLSHSKDRTNGKGKHKDKGKAVGKGRDHDSNSGGGKGKRHGESENKIERENKVKTKGKGNGSEEVRGNGHDSNAYNDNGKKNDNDDDGGSGGGDGEDDDDEVRVKDKGKGESKSKGESESKSKGKGKGKEKDKVKSNDNGKGSDKGKSQHKGEGEGKGKGKGKGKGNGKRKVKGRGNGKGNGKDKGNSEVEVEGGPESDDTKDDSGSNSTSKECDSNGNGEPEGKIRDTILQKVFGLLHGDTVSVEEAESAFKQLDVDGDGLVTAAELAHVVASGGDGGAPSPALATEETAEMAADIVDAFDHSRDGAISLAEWVGFLCPGTVSAETRAGRNRRLKAPLCMRFRVPNAEVSEALSYAVLLLNLTGPRAATLQDRAGAVELIMYSVSTRSGVQGGRWHAARIDISVSGMLEYATTQYAEESWRNAKHGSGLLPKARFLDLKTSSVKPTTKAFRNVVRRVTDRLEERARASSVVERNTLANVDPDLTLVVMPQRGKGLPAVFAAPSRRAYDEILRRLQWEQELAAARAPAGGAEEVVRETSVAANNARVCERQQAEEARDLGAQKQQWEAELERARRVAVPPRASATAYQDRAHGGGLRGRSEMFKVRLIAGESLGVRLRDLKVTGGHSGLPLRAGLDVGATLVRVGDVVPQRDAQVPALLAKRPVDLWFRKA
eukprot:g2364.t1